MMATGARELVNIAVDFARRHCRAFAFALAALFIVLYLLGVPRNPPGFFVDESSISYNAHLIAQSGADEHGERWPLYFRAFGEYKNPVYIYLLAALYKLTGPSIAVARFLSAIAGLLAAALLGLVAARMLKHKDAPDDLARNALVSETWISNTVLMSNTVGLLVFFTALLTPWLFEIGRLVFEVAIMPAALALFLYLLRRASELDEWTWQRAAGLAAALALITYVYSTGRILAPLFAIGLLCFATGRQQQQRRFTRSVLRVWALYAVALVPLLVFNFNHPGALKSRFYDVSFITPQSSWTEIVPRFLRNYFGNFNLWSWLVAGDPEPRHHLAGMGSFLAATFALMVIGIIVVIVRERRDAWWRFMLYGLIVAPVPSSLTIDRFHTLRLVAAPVFALMLAARGMAWLIESGARHQRERRAVFTVLILLMFMQGALFQWQFQRSASLRWHSFDTFYTEVFDAALAWPERPVYIIDGHGAPGYMHAYWYATLRGMSISQFVRLNEDERPPSGALVISTEMPCQDCEMILQRGSFRAYTVR